MLFQIVHTIGSTIYFTIFILFYCVSLVPRTNTATRWWAAAILCALISRLSYYIVSHYTSSWPAFAIYSAINIPEKVFLFIGFSHFLGKPLKTQWIYILAIASEAWLAIAYSSGIPLWIYGIGLTAYNSGLLAYIALLVFKHRRQFHPNIMLVICITSGLMAIHWLTLTCVFFYPLWAAIGFLLGTLLLLTLYLSLLGALLMDVERRLIDAEEYALDLAYHDPLTGLNNKRYMSMLFDKALMLATRPHQFLAIFYIDLDNFKPINDAAGHTVGDEALKIIAQRLKDNTRSTDICARIGGDEFVVIATQLEHEQHAEEIAQKLLTQLNQEIIINEHAYTLGASIGVSLYPLHGTNLNQLMSYADMAMYEIKRNGKSGYHIHQVAPQSQQPH